jgi:hypothetical protein
MIKKMLDQAKRLVLNDDGTISLTKVGALVTAVCAEVLRQHLLPASCDPSLTWGMGLGAVMLAAGARDAISKTPKA